jgi:hypothetical protein
MASSARSIDFKTALLQLPTAKQQVNFSHIFNRVLGIAHYADENPTAFFDVTAKALKGCDNNYHLYKPQLSQLFEINDSYQAKSGAGFCKRYRLKIPIFLSDFEFKDTLTHSESVDFDHFDRRTENKPTTKNGVASEPLFKTIHSINYHPSVCS